MLQNRLILYPQSLFFYCVAHYCSENRFAVIIRRIDDDKKGWKIPLKLLIFDEFDQRSEWHDIGTSQKNQKYQMIEVCTIKLVAETWDVEPSSFIMQYHENAINTDNNAYLSIIEQNPRHQYRQFDENSARQFLIKHFEKQVCDTFDRLNPKTLKELFFTSCFLYNEGGIYINHGYICLSPLKQNFGHDVILAKKGDQQMKNLMTKMMNHENTVHCIDDFSIKEDGRDLLVDDHGNVVCVRFYNKEKENLQNYVEKKQLYFNQRHEISDRFVLYFCSTAEFVFDLNDNDDLCMILKKGEWDDDFRVHIIDQIRKKSLTLYINSTSTEICRRIFLREEFARVQLLNRIYQSIHNLEGGQLMEEYMFHLICVMYIDGNEKILEIGGGIGTTSLVVSAILHDETNLVVLEPHPRIYEQLGVNRIINNRKFRIDNCTLSTKNLIQMDSNVLQRDEFMDDFVRVSITDFVTLQKKHRILFDTLIIDCEGSFPIILKEFPNLLADIHKIVMKNNYVDIHDKMFLDSILKTSGFNRIYSKDGGWGVCQDQFYEVWTLNDHVSTPPV